MQITVKRTIFSDLSTEGELSIDGFFECYTLEDKDRGLISTQDLGLINSLKVQNETAIPYGFYSVGINQSERFGRLMPIVNDVPGFAGVRIHSGNTAADTDGCILVGQQKGIDFIGSSRLAFDAFYERLEAAVNRNEEVQLTITKG